MSKSSPILGASHKGPLFLSAQPSNSLKWWFATIAIGPVHAGWLLPVFPGHLIWRSKIWRMWHALLHTCVNCTELYCTALNCTAPNCSVLHTCVYCTLPYCTILYCTAHNCSVLYTWVKCTKPWCTAGIYGTILICSALCIAVYNCTSLHWYTALTYALYCTTLH